MTIFSLVFFLFSTFAYSISPLYVLGETYVGYFKPGEPFLTSTGIEPNSWALDSERCRLWLTSKNNSKLIVFEHGVRVFEKSFSGRIVSEVSRGRFATLNENNYLEIRDLNGQVQSQYPFSNGTHLKQVQLTKNGGSWNLFQGGDRRSNERLWLSQTDDSGTELIKIPVEANEELWGKAILAVDEPNHKLWVGYTRSTPQHMYSPRVVQFETTGTQFFSYQWDQRGILFDGCLKKDGDFLIARDIPSSGYTVPVYSYLERVVQGINPSILLNLNTNLLVDSLNCRQNSVYMGVHSVLGGEPHQILFWDGDLNKNAEPLFTVAPKIQKVLTCD